MAGVIPNVFCPRGMRTHTVEAGDTLYIISQRYNTTVDAIITVNPGIEQDNLRVGQRICIPRGNRNTNMPQRPSVPAPNQNQGGSTGGNMITACPAGLYSYIIQDGDTLWLLAQRFRTSVEAIMAVNPGINPANLFVGQVICVPYEGGATVPPPQPRPQPQPGTPPQPRPQPQPGTPPQPRPQPQQPPVCVSSAEHSLNNYLRLLWSQHVYWTRMFIISAVYGLPDEIYVSNRLSQNPGDFEMVLRPFYGEENAAQFANLLTTHLQIAGELVGDMIAGNTMAAEDAERRWYDNADQIAEFLSSINPNWTVQDWKKMLYDHLAMLKSEAEDIMDQNFEDSISMFGNIEQEAMEMADAMAQGIAAQFPQYFSM